jgi:hypothetical protein
VPFRQYCRRRLPDDMTTTVKARPRILDNGETPHFLGLGRFPRLDRSRTPVAARHVERVPFYAKIILLTTALL